MANKKVDIFDTSKNDKLDKIIQNLNNPPDNGDSKDYPVTKQPTIVDEYLEILRLRREIASTIYNKFLKELLKDPGNVDPNLFKEVTGAIGFFLGLGDRWSNDVLKLAIGTEFTTYGSFVNRIYPDYIGDPIANYQRSIEIGTKDDTSILISNLMQLLGINLSPEIIDKLAKMLKDKLGNK